MNSKIKLLTYSKAERNIYLISLIGQVMIYNVIGTGLAYYLQFTLLIPALTVGIIMTSARVWDAVNDFIMGTIVDRTRTRWGKCRPYLIFAPLPIFIVTVLCFINFGIYGESSVTQDILIVAWASATYILWGMIYTIGDIPLWGITALMTEDAGDRNKLISLAKLAGGVGSITMLAIIPLSISIGSKLSLNLGSGAEGERWGFFVAALILSALGYCLYQIAGFRVKERVIASDNKYTIKQNLRIIMGNKPFKQILLSGILSSPKMLILLAAMPLVNYYFASKDPVMAFLYMLLLGGGMFLGMFIAMGLTPRLLKRFSKKNLYNYSNLISVLPFLMIFIIYILAPKGAIATSPILLSICFLLFMISGASMGVILVLQSAMIADCIDYEEHKNNVRPDGVFFAGQTFLAKLTTGIATIISAIAYTIVKFSGDRIGELNKYIENMTANDPLPREMAEYDSFMMILFFLVSIPPAIGCLLSVIPTLKYALDDNVHSKIIKELNIRRHSTQ